MKKPNVKFVKLQPKAKQRYYLLIATNAKGQKIAFEVDGIK